MACLLSYITKGSYLPALPSRVLNVTTTPRPVLPACYTAKPVANEQELHIDEVLDATAEDVHCKEGLEQDGIAEPASKRRKLTNDVGTLVAEPENVKIVVAHTKSVRGKIPLSKIAIETNGKAIDEPSQAEAASEKMITPGAYRNKELPTKHQDVIAHLNMINVAHMYNMTDVQSEATELFFQILEEQLSTEGFAKALIEILQITTDRE